MIVYNTDPLKDALTPKFCWRPEWISPYESPWSIFEKFKFANQVSSKDILKCFASDYVQKLKTVARSHYNLVTLSVFDSEKVKSGLQYDLIDENKINLDRMVGILPGKLLNGREYYLSYYLRSDLFYCPLCLESGFHSIFHQFKMVHKCPYHEVPLLRSCPKCNQRIPYELSDKYVTDPFQCACGHSFIKMTEKNHLINWRQTPASSISCNRILSWLSLTDEQKQRLKQCYFFRELDLEHYEGAMDYFLSVIDPAYKSVIPEKHIMVSSATYINHIRGTKEKEEIRRYSKTNYPNINEFEIYKMRYQAFQTEMYQSSMISISGIAQHLRKTIFMKHRTCIHRLIKNGDQADEAMCPFAYAYLNWRRYVQNYNTFSGIIIDRPSRRSKSSIEFPPVAGQYLYDLYEEMKLDFEDPTKVSRSSLKWIFNRLIVHFTMNHFYNWLETSQKYADNKVIKRFLPKEFNHLPFFIIKLSNNNESHEFHWWIKELEEQIELICPYNSVSSRREEGRLQKIKKAKQFREKYLRST